MAVIKLITGKAVNLNRVITSAIEERGLPQVRQATGSVRNKTDFRSE